VLLRILPLLGFLTSITTLPHTSPCCLNEKDPVKVTLVVILASEEGKTIDPQLKAIADEVQKQNPNLKSFKLHTMQNKSLKVGEKVSLPIVETKKLEMLVKQGANKDNRVTLSIFPPDIGEIEYQTVCGKFLPIVTRCKTKEGQRIILAIRVQPCRGE
jgi:hypothetical protein